MMKQAIADLRLALECARRAERDPDVRAMPFAHEYLTQAIDRLVFLVGTEPGEDDVVAPATVAHAETDQETGVRP